MTGKDITVILSQNNTALASTCIKSQDIQTKAEAIEVASSTQQDWKEFIAGRKEWSLTVSYLVLSSAKVADLLYTGQVFDISIKEVGSSSSLLTGTALMTAVKQVASVGNLCQGSFSLQGSGPLRQW
jgi:predicted secreted protein